MNGDKPINRVSAILNAQGQRAMNTGNPTLKQEYDARKEAMKAKTIQDSVMKMHKHVLSEVDKLVTPSRKRLCAAIFPRPIYNAIALILRCLPPDPLVRWAMSGTLGAPHIAYRWFILLPMVIPASIIRTFIIKPLTFIQNWLWIRGIKQDIKQLNEFETELTISQKGGPTLKWKQDWRTGEMRKC